MLGYDLENLTGQQRTTVELKAESDFADLPLEEMTVEQQQELATRYNRGPYWENDQAQRYGRDFAHHLDQARNAIR
ncbi:hypothetical protein RKD21_005811 [Streptomyces albogriseolus]|uniref:Uncharacterized protein n=1 Tax=Streptomyces albogriseolus TaxID=1887 RepID=A0ACC6UVL2_STRAO